MKEHPLKSGPLTLMDQDTKKRISFHQQQTSEGESYMVNPDTQRRRQKKAKRRS
jgi:hypothetical protein